MTFFLPRKVLRLLAKLLVGLVFFAQGVIGVHACTTAERSQHFGTTQTAAAAEACHEAAAAPSASNPASCAAHCGTSDQRVDTPQSAMAAVPAIAVLTAPFAPDPAPLQRPARQARVAAPDPPITIRFQVFRT